MNRLNILAAAVLGFSMGLIGCSSLNDACFTMTVDQDGLDMAVHCPRPNEESPDVRIK